MSIKYAILGFLSVGPLTGYDLKKRFAESETLYWSGNNNQIYRALVDLHDEKLVTREVQHQESNPSRKVYTITDAGRQALQGWLLSPPELPQVRNAFLVQLTWADQLPPDALDALLGAYEDELQVKVLMLREHYHRNHVPPAETPRAALLRSMIEQNWLSIYENERDWVRRLRSALLNT